MGARTSIRRCHLDRSVVDSLATGIFIWIIVVSKRNSFLGTRLGITDHIDDNHRVHDFQLTNEDRKDIDHILEQSNGRKLITSIGDCGAEYR